MDTITIIKADASDIFEFSSKQVEVLDSLWEGSWTVADELGGVPVLEGSLSKNENIMNDDSLEFEDFRKSYKIYETDDKELVRFNDDVILGTSCVVSGKMYKDGVDVDSNPIEIPEVDRYITITLKGIFVTYSREIRLKTDANGEFSHDFNIGATIKTPANSFFIFQMMPLQSELLNIKTYIISIEVRQKDAEGIIVFRREVLQNKLKVTKQGVQ